MRQLDNLDDLILLLDNYPGIIQTNHVSIISGMYCSHCGGDRRMDVRVLTPSGMPHSDSPSDLLEQLRSDYAPMLLTYQCTQCEAFYTALIYENESTEGLGLAVFPRSKGSFSTPHTPEPVDYFLDQVYRCLSVGALPAALSMYRAAMDQIMINQGYNQRMLGHKIGALQQDIAGGKAPAWAIGLNPEFIRVLKDLGDAVLHVDDGDVASLRSLDAKLLSEVKITIQELLEIIYEESARRVDRLESLRNTVDKLSNP